MLPILYRYLLSQILKFICVVLLLVVGIYVMVDFFEKIDNFMEAGLAISRALVFFGYMIPFIIAQIGPVCILLSVLVTFGLMNKNNEIIALKSSGISLYYLLRPVVMLGILSSLLLFVFAEGVVPATVEKANRIWLTEVKGESAVVSREKNIWIKEPRRILHIEYYNPGKQMMLDLTVHFFDGEFKLVRRVDAKQGVFNGKKWILYEVMEQTLNRETGKYEVRIHNTAEARIDLVPADLKQVVKKSEEMSFQELWEYVRKVESEGYDATLYRVDLHAKVAFPFICLILALVGTGIAVRPSMKEGLAVSIAYGIGIAFLYWTFYSFCLSLGYGEILAPVVAAWTANLIFFCFAVLLLLHAE